MIELIDTLKSKHVQTAIKNLAEQVADESGLHTAGSYARYDDYIVDKITEELEDGLEGVLDDIELETERDYGEGEADAAAERKWEMETGR